MGLNNTNSLHQLFLNIPFAMVCLLNFETVDQWFDCSTLQKCDNFFKIKIAGQY